MAREAIEKACSHAQDVIEIDRVKFPVHLDNIVILYDYLGFNMASGPTPKYARTVFWVGCKPISIHLLGTTKNMKISFGHRRRVFNLATLANTNGRVTAGQFYNWNPNIDALCMNLNSPSSRVVCIGPPGSDANSPGGTGSITPIPATPVPTTAAPVPTNHAPNSTTNCAQWYTTKQGDTCLKITTQFKISLADFYFLNPMIDSRCSNLWISTSYCARPVGSISTYSGYPTTAQPYTLTSETFTTETWKTVPLNPPAMPVASEYPLAAGTWSNCTLYQNVNPKPPFVDQSDASVNRDFYWASLYQCNTTASIYGITMEQLFIWNPSLASSGSIAACILQPELRYCTLAGDSPPLQPGTSLCDSITAQDVKPVIGVDQGLYTCASLIEEHKISLKSFLAWNPWIGPDCDTGLYAGLSIKDASNYTAACVRLGTGQSTSSISKSISTSTSTPTSPSSSTTSSSSATPVQPSRPLHTQQGIALGCSEYHTVVQGDICYDLAQANGISLDKFYAWNPPVGKGCPNLWIGYDYCVAGGP
ncbi:hypothetical protein BT63DRAFT_415636 [Microthyrium microscopicum]|uniref:LysM domain-containing protein n=1 Tax=Microthyrium microscopicum TaxID=703497 RepID=A0A6A6U3L0_9PEZI|nr:hypothetical protein BT63DRAFT_415636 [Microthyrium microscopicum]